jgi:hypothetical protein
MFLVRRARSVLGVKAGPASRVARLRASLDPCARLRLVVSMDFGETSRPAGRLGSPKSWKQNAAAARRSHREAGEAQRSSREAA